MIIFIRAPQFLIPVLSENFPYMKKPTVFQVINIKWKWLSYTCIKYIIIIYIYVVVNFLFQVIFIFPLFLGMVIYANEFETKEKQKLPEIKNELQHIHDLYIVDPHVESYKLPLRLPCC